jgi:hypothetical protein
MLLCRLKNMHVGPGRRGGVGVGWGEVGGGVHEDISALTTVALPNIP